MREPGYAKIVELYGTPKGHIIEILWFKEQSRDQQTGFPILIPSVQDNRRIKWKVFYHISLIKREVVLSHCCTRNCAIKDGVVEHLGNPGKYLLNTNFN